MKKLIVILLAVWLFANLGFNLNLVWAQGPDWYGQQPFSPYGWTYDNGFSTDFWNRFGQSRLNNINQHAMGAWGPSYNIWWQPMFPSGARSDGAFLGGYGSAYQQGPFQQFYGPNLGGFSLHGRPQYAVPFWKFN